MRLRGFLFYKSSVYAAFRGFCLLNDDFCWFFVSCGQQWATAVLIKIVSKFVSKFIMKSGFYLLTPLQLTHSTPQSRYQ